MTDLAFRIPPDVELDDETGTPKSVLGKAQLLLAAFGAGAVQLRLTELSRRSGVPKASAYRLAQELVQWGLLERVGNSYQLGLRVFELGQRVPVAAILRRVSRPALVDLYAATRATVHLIVPDGTHVLFLEKIAGAANVLTHSEVGGRLPASCSASGKLFLALRPDGRAILAELSRHELMRPTTRSVPTLEALGAQLAEVRKRGHSVELEEMLVGHSSLAVPVVDAYGEIYAAVSITMPTSQLIVPRLLPIVQATAGLIHRAVEARTAA
ncbi:IclR family transcriptional regulator [Paractinoplanes lichenicola]|uniref:IclR family transcriptional regulator n=1 Tax=Paractinoplanes lichenicola TaxID=2802976 RepID=A0ABS1VLH9_9ACTN|nr:IclR family transcriptional regulator [Actinoplanes lichenicola]MBL7255579.1 IclR family transcriptional regulator [Actinoplanes lichenicola]